MPRVATDNFSGEDLVRAYLHEIGRRPLLAADEEVALAKTIEAGSKAARGLDRDDSSLSNEARTDLQHRFDEGEEARKAFTEANLRLVVSIARRYQGFGLHLLDLIQDGNIGLLRAVEKYDWRRGFSSPRTRLGGSGRGSHAGSPNARARSGSPCTSPRW